MKIRLFNVLFILFLVTAGVTQISLGDYVNIDNGNIVIKDGSGTTQVDANGNIKTNSDSGSTYIDKNGNVIVNDKSGTTYVDGNGNVRLDDKGQQYYVDNKGNVIYTTPDTQYNINNNGGVIYTAPDKKYYVDNSGSVTINETGGNYSSPPGTPYVDSKGAYYINDIIYSNCDEFPASDYIAYGNQRQGKSGWEFICQGYTFSKPVVVSDIVISSIIFRGNNSGEIGIKVFNDKYKIVFQEKNYKKAAGQILPAGTYYFYPLINSKSTKDCTLRLFLNKKN